MAPSLPFIKSSKISASSLFGRKNKRSSNTSDGASASATAVVPNDAAAAASNNEQPLIPDWNKIKQDGSQQSISPSASQAQGKRKSSAPDWNLLEQHAEELSYTRKRNSIVSDNVTEVTNVELTASQLPTALRRADSINVNTATANAENKRSLTGVSFAAREPDDERLIPSRNTPAYLREQLDQNIGLVNTQHFRYDADGPLQAMHENSISAVAIVHKTLSTTTLKDTQQQQLEALTPETVPLREYNSSSLMTPSPTPPARATMLDTQRSPSAEMRISTAIEHRSSSYVDGEEQPTRWSLRNVDADVPTLKATNSTSMSSIAKKPTVSRDSGINDPSRGSARPASLQIPEKARSGKNSNSSSTHALPDVTASSGPTVTYLTNEAPNGAESPNNARSSSPAAHHRHHKKKTTSSGGTSTAAEGLQTEDVGLVSDATGFDSPAAKKYRTLAPSVQPKTVAIKPVDSVTGGQAVNANADDSLARQHGISTSPLRPVKSNYSATAIANDRIKESIMALYVDRTASKQQVTGGDREERDMGRPKDVGFVVRNDDDETDQENVLPNTQRDLARDPSNQHLRTDTRPGTATSRKPSSNLFRSPSITRSAPHAPTSTVVPAAEEDDDVNNDVNSSAPEPAPRLSRTNNNGAAEQRLSTAWAADSIRRIFSTARESREHEEVVPTDNLIIVNQQAGMVSASSSRDDRLAERGKSQSQPKLQQRTARDLEDTSSLSNLSLTSSQGAAGTARNGQTPSSRNKSRSRSDPTQPSNEETFSVDKKPSKSMNNDQAQHQQPPQPARGLAPTTSSASSFRTTESDMGKRYATALLNDYPSKEFRPIEPEYAVQRFVRDEDLLQQATSANGAANATMAQQQQQQQQQSQTAISAAGSHRSQPSPRSNRSENGGASAAVRAPAITTTAASNAQLQQQASQMAADLSSRPVYLAGSSAQRLNNNNNDSNVSQSGSIAVINRQNALERRASGTANSHHTNMSYASSATLGILTNEPRAGAAAAASATQPFQEANGGPSPHNESQAARQQLNRQNSQRSGSRSANNNNNNINRDASVGDRQRPFGIDPSTDMLALDADIDDSNTITNTNRDDQSYADEDDDGAGTNTEADEYDDEVLRSLADARQISVARFPHAAVVKKSNNSAVDRNNIEEADHPVLHPVLQPSFASGLQQLNNNNNAVRMSLSHASSGGAYRDMQNQQQARALNDAEMLAIMASANPSYRDLQLERLNELVNMNQTLSNEIVLAASLPPSSHASQHQQQQQQQQQILQRTDVSTASAASRQTHQLTANTAAMSNKSSRHDALPHQQQQQQQQQNNASSLVVPSNRRTAASSPAKSSRANMQNDADQPQHRSLTNIKTTASSSDATRRALSQAHEQFAQLSPSQQQLLLYQSMSQTRSNPDLPPQAQQQIDTDTGQTAAGTDDDEDNVIGFKEVGSGDFNQMIESLQTGQQMMNSYGTNSSLAKSRMQSISNASASTAGHSPRSQRSKASFRVGGANSSSNVQSVASTDANHVQHRSEHALPTTSASRQRVPIVHAAASEHSRTGVQPGLMQSTRSATAPRLHHTASRVGFQEQQQLPAHSHHSIYNKPSSSSRPQVQRSLSGNVYQQPDSDEQDRFNTIPTITNAKRLSDSDESIEFESKQSRTVLGVLDARRRANEQHNTIFLGGSPSSAEPPNPSRVNADVTSSTIKPVSSAEHARRVLACTAMLRPPGLLRTNHTFDEQLTMLHDLHSISPTENVVSHAILEHANANATFGSRIYPQPKVRVAYEALQLTSGALTRLIENGTGGEVFLLGVERFNQQNVNDVRDLIEQTQPDIVFVQLGADVASARSRRSVTTVHDPSGQTASELYLKDSTPPWLPGSWSSVVRHTIERHGFINGLIHLLHLDLEASHTRRHTQSAQIAFREAVSLGDAAPFCDVVFGDRSNDLTFCRAYSTLNIFEKVYLILRLVFAHMHGDSYAALTSLTKMRRVLVDERDKFMCASLQYYAQSLIRTSEGMRPLTVVAVVSAEHVIGIKHYWRHALDVRPLQTMPATPYGRDEVVLRKVASWTPWIVLGAVGLYAGYKALKHGVPLVRGFSSSIAAKQIST